MKKKNNVMGIDPSMTETGIVVLDQDGESLVEETINTKPPKDKNPRTETLRLVHIANEILKYINKYSPEIISMEGISLSSRNTNILAQLCGLNYLIRNVCFNYSDNFYIVPPTTLKKFVTGTGSCQKDLMLLETYKRYGKSFDNNNICDAYGLAKISEALINEQNVKLTKPQDDVINMLKKQYEKS